MCTLKVNSKGQALTRLRSFSMSGLGLQAGNDESGGNRKRGGLWRQHLAALTAKQLDGPSRMHSPQSQKAAHLSEMSAVDQVKATCGCSLRSK